ncbi:MAG: hypothetical protein V7727_02485, partial [Sneathiella sp.]
ELVRRAQEYIEAFNAEMEEKRLALGVSDEILAIEALSPPMVVALGEAGIKTLDDLADLSGDELISPEDGILKEFGLNPDLANDVVMAARAHWFEDEETAVEDEETTVEDEEPAVEEEETASDEESND